MRRFLRDLYRPTHRPLHVRMPSHFTPAAKRRADAARDAADRRERQRRTALQVLIPVGAIAAAVALYFAALTLAAVIVAVAG